MSVSVPEHRRPAGWPNVSASDVAAPVEARLREGLAPFLAAASAPLSRPLEEPREWFRLPAFAALTTAVTPTVAVIVDGLTGPPTYDRRTGYRASWDVTAAVWIRGGDHGETRVRCEQYVAAMRACLLSTADGLARRWVWADEHYDTVSEAGAARTLAGGYLLLTVDVESAVVPAAIAGDVELPPFTDAAVAANPTRVRARGYLADLTTEPAPEP